MKNIILILLTLFFFLQTSAQSESIILPGVGVIHNSDTFFIAKDNFQSVIEKIDTSKNKVVYDFGYGTACGYAITIDSLTNDSTWERASWGFHNGTLAWSNSIEIHFKGEEKNDLKIEKILINYPHNASIQNSLKTEDNYIDIFNYYDKTEGSYNCGEKGLNYCYYKEGITFRVQPYKEGPNPDMVEKIIGFEIYEIRK